jgi:uncharacterized protein YdhG (YjbR/CyaY superfamily)
MASTAKTIDEYIAAYPADAQLVLERIRAIVREVAPDATETISYAIPTFDLDGRHLIHFAAYAHHVSVYPVPKAEVPFEDELAPYRSGQGTAKFPLAQSLPVDLVRRLVTYRLEGIAGGR